MWFYFYQPALETIMMDSSDVSFTSTRLDHWPGFCCVTIVTNPTFGFPVNVVIYLESIEILVHIQLDGKRKATTFSFVRSLFTITRRKLQGSHNVQSLQNLFRIQNPQLFRSVII